MRRIKEIALVSMLTVLGAIGLAACGGTTATSTPVAATSVATTAPTAMMEATAEPTAMMAATTEPTAMMEATSAPTAMMEATTEPTAMMVATTAPTAMMEATVMTQPTTSGGGGGGLTITGPGADLLNKYFTAQKDLKSYHTVSESIISAGGTTITSKSESDFQAPNLSRTITEIPGVGNTETITIGGDSYSKSPGVDTYFHTSFALPVNPDDISFLPFVESADIVGDETIDGVATTHLKYTYDADKFMAQMGQPTPVVAMGKTTAEVWLDKSTNFPVREKTITPAATITVTRSKFNEPVSPPIEKPTNVTEMPTP